MKKILFLFVSFVLCGIVIFAQDSTDNKKNEFVLKLVNDIVAACEEGKDTTMRTDEVMTADSLKSYIISVAKGDSVVFDSLTTEERDKVVDFVKVVASKADSDSAKTIVTTVKRSTKKITFDLDFDALGDSIVFELDLDSVK